MSQVLEENQVKRNTVLSGFRRVMRSVPRAIWRGQLQRYKGKGGRFSNKLRDKRIHASAALVIRLLNPDLTLKRSYVALSGRGTYKGGGARMVDKRTLKKVSRRVTRMVLMRMVIKYFVFVAISGGRQPIRGRLHSEF